jgi:hypothetical protein
MQNRQLNIDDAKELIVNMIEESRSNAQFIIRQVREFDSEYEQEMYLLQSFIAHTMPSILKRTAAYKHFFRGNFSPFLRYSRVQMLAEYFSLICLPLSIMAALLYIFTQGLFIGPDATQSWVLSVTVTILLDIIVLQPIKIWINWVAAGSIVEEQARACLGLLRDRAIFLLKRTKGSITHSNSLIQHFNPVCRAARYYPHFPISRLIISLNDFDLPTDYIVSTKSFWFRLENQFSTYIWILCSMWAACPLIVQDSFNEILITLMIGFFIAFCGYMTFVNVGLIVTFLIVASICFCCREYYSHRRRSNLKRYLAPVEVESSASMDNIIRSGGLSEMQGWLASFLQVSDVEVTVAETFDEELAEVLESRKNLNDSLYLNSESKYQGSYTSLAGLLPEPVAELSIVDTEVPMDERKVSFTEERVELAGRFEHENPMKKRVSLISSPVVDNK